MRRSVSVRISTVLLVATLALPAMAAPRRDDSPMDRFESAISRVLHNIQRHICDLGDLLTGPK